MAAEQKPKKSGRRALVIVAIIIVLALLLILALWPPSTGSGQVKFSGINIQWNGATYTLLDTPYSSSTSDHGYGSVGFTFNVEFNASGTCAETTGGCFNPGTNFNITSVTSGFRVSWVTACYQSRGYPALVGGVFYRYSSSPGSPLSGCSSSTSSQVDMTGVGTGTLVYLTVAVQFITSSYSGSLTLKATNTQSVSVETGDPTTTAILCTPSTIVVDAVTSCTVTVDDTASPSTAPTGFVNFTSSSGQFGPGSSCTLAPSSTNSSSACSVNYEAATAGSNLILANYNGDSTHVSSSAGFSVNAFYYTLTVSPTNQNVTVGSSVSYTVTATLFQGSANNLPNITLSVQNCVSGIMTCTFSPAEITPTTAGATSILMITVPQQPAVQLPASFSFTVTGTTGNGTLVFTMNANSAGITINP